MIVNTMGYIYSQVVRLSIVRYRRLPRHNYESILFNGSTGLHIAARYGNEYYCSCLGFHFRGDCKHVRLLKDIGRSGKLVGIEFSLEDVENGEVPIRYLDSSLKPLNDIFGEKVYSSRSIFSVYAEPNVGKTLFLLQEAFYFLSKGYNVLYIDTEGGVAEKLLAWKDVFKERFGEPRGTMKFKIMRQLEDIMYYFGYKVLCRYVSADKKGTKGKHEFQVVESISEPPINKEVKENKIDVVIIDSVTSPFRIAFQISAQQSQPAKCFTPDTEVFTKDGWKPISEVKIGDVVLSYSDGVLEYATVVDAWEQEYDGMMVHIGGRNKTVDLMVTPNHRMPVKWRRWNGEIVDKVVNACDLNRQHSLIRTGIWNGEDIDYVELPDGTKVDAELWMKFIGLFIAEGYLHKDKGHWEHVYIANRIYKKSIDEIMRALPFNVRRHASGNYCISNKILAEYMASLGLDKKQLERRIPAEYKELSPRLLRALLYGMWLGDGTTNKGTKYIVTGNKKLADDIVEIAIKAGYGSNVVSRTMDTEINGYVYKGRAHYSVVIHEWAKGYTITPSVIEYVKYKGKVYNVTVRPNNNLLVRRNGKTVFAGNSDAMAIFYDSLLNLQDKYDVFVLTAHHASINPANMYDVIPRIRGGNTPMFYSKRIFALDRREKKGQKHYRRFWLVRADGFEDFSVIAFSKIDYLGYRELTDKEKDGIKGLLTTAEQERAKRVVV